MTFDTFQALFIALVFLVPGFILHSVLSMFAPQRIEKIEFSFLRLLTLSSFNFAVWSWLVYLIYYRDLFAGSAHWEALSWFLVVFISPVILGVAFGMFSEKQLIRKLFQSLGYSLIWSIPTAWDYKLNEIRKSGPVWVLVTLKDGSRVSGLFGTKSFAATAQSGRDIYIQRVYRLDENDIWKPSVNDGILIQGDEIRYIEFWEY